MNGSLDLRHVCQTQIDIQSGVTFPCSGVCHRFFAKQWVFAFDNLTNEDRIAIVMLIRQPVRDYNSFGMTESQGRTLMYILHHFGMLNDDHLSTDIGKQCADMLWSSVN